MFDSRARVAEGTMAFRCQVCDTDFAKPASWVQMVEQVHCPACVTPQAVDREEFERCFGVRHLMPARRTSRAKAASTERSAAAVEQRDPLALARVSDTVTPLRSMRRCGAPCVWPASPEKTVAQSIRS